MATVTILEASKEVIPPKITSNRVDLTWRGVSYHVDTRGSGKGLPCCARGELQTLRLLQDVSGTAFGGRVLAIMGPSGAGKTTLLRALSGRLPVSKTECLVGSCFLNALPLKKEYKSLFSVVPQDDIVMGKETPRDALRFSARMRLGLDYKKGCAVADELLERMHLTACADTLVGIPGVIKGISGGEKKRVNIGCELVTNPSIMLLDEPTTGLDSVNAVRVGSLLKELAHNEGRTVICTIHTPSSQLYELFDDILLLAKGRVVYHGPTAMAPEYFASVGHPLSEHQNPSEHFMDVLQLPDSELKLLWEAWEGYNQWSFMTMHRDSFLSSMCAKEMRRQPQLLESKRKKDVGIFTQFAILLRRSFRMLRRDPGAFIGRLVQTIIVALITGLFYFNIDTTSAGVITAMGVLFFTSVNMVMSSIMPGLSAFPPERKIFLVEQASELYNPALYTIAKLISEAPLGVLFPTLMSAIVYFMIDLHKSADAFFVFWIILVLTSVTAQSLGLFLSGVFPRAELAFALGPLILLPMVLVGGLFANTERLEPDFIWLSRISFVRYAFVAILRNQFTRVGNICPSDPVGGTGCLYLTGNEVVTLLGFDDWRLWHSIVALVLFILFFWAITVGVMFVQGMMQRNRLHFDEDPMPIYSSPRETSAGSPKKSHMSSSSLDKKQADGVANNDSHDA